MMDRFFASNKKSAFLLMCGLIIFLISYFFVTTPKIHNTIFYALTLLPLLCAVEKKHLIYLHRSWLINGLVLFLLYSFSTTFWSDFYSKELLFRAFKRVLYIYGLFLACYVVIDAFPSFPARLLQAGSLCLSIFACICIFLFLMETHPHFIHDPIRMWGLGALYHPSFFSGILLCYVVGLFVHLKELYETLELPYRMITLRANDMAKKATIERDMELWFEGEQRWGEVGSYGLTGDFQARRGNIKFEGEGVREDEGTRRRRRKK